MSQMGFEEEVQEYVRPTLAEVLARPRNGLTAVGSFSGCGGSSTGLKMAGWNVPYVIEFVDAAADTYEANAPEAFVDRRDIRKIEPQEILDKLGLKPGDLDLFEGSPPCSSFSSAGTGHKTRERPCDRCKGTGTIDASILDGELSKTCELCGGSGRLAGVSKSYSDTEQETHDLFWEWMRILDGLRPRAFLAENVPGMLRGDAREYADQIIKDLQALGYRVNWKILHAQWYGAPQLRERLIFMGIRNDVADGLPEFPTPTVDPPFTLRQALEAVPELDPAHVAASSMENYAVGRSWKMITEARAEGREVDFTRMPCQRCGEPVTPSKHTITKETQEGLPTQAICADGEKAVIAKEYFMLVVPDLDRPCPTVTATGAQAGAASVTHPTECRKFTPAELLSISGFPEGFQLTGTREQQCERMGRAVPPPMYEACGRTLAEFLK